RTGARHLLISHARLVRLSCRAIPPSAITRTIADGRDAVKRGVGVHGRQGSCLLRGVRFDSAGAGSLTALLSRWNRHDVYRMSNSKATHWLWSGGRWSFKPHSSTPSCRYELQRNIHWADNGSLKVPAKG